MVKGYEVVIGLETHAELYELLCSLETLEVCSLLELYRQEMLSI